MGIFAITLIIGAASLAMAGVPDVDNCLATRTYTGPEKLVVFVVPGGDVNAGLDVAVQWVDQVVYPAPGIPQTIHDGTILVTVLDGAEPPQPCQIYPFEDMWLSCVGLGVESGLTPCIGGANADYSTLADGTTQFSNPISGGGYSTGPTSVVINGNAIPQTVDISYNSPDMNGDLVVDGIDFQTFASHYTDAGEFMTDLYHDGRVDGVDFQKFVSWYLANCSD